MKDLSSHAMLARLREKRRSRSRPRYRGPGLVVGRRADGSLLIIPDSVLDSTSIQLIAPPGFGKSCLLYYLACEQILRRPERGLLILDLHGSLADMVVNFCCVRRVPPSRLVLIQPLLSQFTTCLNPLQSFGPFGSGAALAGQVCIRTSGETSFEPTPRIGKYVPASCLTLETHKLPLALLPWFLGLGPAAAAFRARLIPAMRDPYARHVFEEFADLNRHDQLTLVESSGSRVAPFLSSEAIRRLITMPTGNLDFKTLMDQGGICIVNLGNLGGAMLSDREKSLVGILVEHGILHAGLRRQPNVSRPFMCIIDEAGSFITEDLSSSLDQLRKFAVSPFVLAHQRKAQIEAVSPNVWSAVLTGCQIKAVFGGLAREDVEFMSKEIYTGEINLEQVKYEVQNVSFRPLTTWEEIVAVNEGGASNIGGSSSRGGSSGFSSSSTSGTSAVYTSDGIFCLGPTGWTCSGSFQQAQSQSENWCESENWSQSRTWGTTRMKVPVTHFEEFLQPASKQFYSLEEAWEMKIALLKSLPKRTLALKVPGQPVELVRTLDVVELVVPPAVLAAYVEQICRGSPYIVPAGRADAEFQRLLAAQGLLPVTVREPVSFAVSEHQEGSTNEPARKDAAVGTVGLPRRAKHRRARRAD